MNLKESPKKEEQTCWKMEWEKVWTFTALSSRLHPLKAIIPEIVMFA
jgi:hypothetical protein